MKFFWFGIFILIVGIGFFWKREARNVSAAPPASEATVTAPKIPTAVGIPSGSPPPSVASKQPTHHDIQPRLEKITEMARYALPTQASRDSLIQDLSDPELHSALGLVLEGSDGLAYDAAQEKLRMNAVSVFGLILRYKDVSYRDETVRWVKQRILAVDFNSMKDLRVKQSVYGDITELLMILRQHEPEAFEEVSQRIEETKNKVLMTALAVSR
jgi:hypothetical protein